MDLTLWLLLAFPLAIVAAQIFKRRTLVVLIGYGSAFFNRIALFNTIPLFSLLGGLAAWTRLRRLPTSPSARALTNALIFGGLTSLVAILWSSDGVAAFTTSLRWLALASLVLLALDVVYHEGISGITRMLVWLSPIAIVQAATTIYFRVNPQAEDSYYNSGLARFFLGDAAPALFTEKGWNNVRELERAGGILFVSVNRAALVMGIMFLLYLGLWLYSKRVLPLVLAILLAVAIVASGSKSGLVLLVIMPLFAFIAAAMTQTRNVAFRLVILLVALIFSSIGSQVFLNVADDFVTSSEKTLVPRYVLWGQAIKAIGENPILGLGFGGWQERWEAGQVEANFLYRPAHNWLLQAWLDGGLIYAAANVVLAVVTVAITFRALIASRNVGEARFIALASSTFLWSYIHGTLDNTPIFADPQAGAFLAIAGAIVVAGTHLSRGDVNDGIGAMTEPTAMDDHGSSARTDRWGQGRQA